MEHRNNDLDLAAFQRSNEESLDELIKQGFVPDTTQWLSLKRYAEKYNVSQQEVEVWIDRGLIPANAIRHLQDIHNIRLIRDQSYA